MSGSRTRAVARDYRHSANDETRPSSHLPPDWLPRLRTIRKSRGHQHRRIFEPMFQAPPATPPVPATTTTMALQQSTGRVPEFMTLPCELRRMILGMLLPSIQSTCRPRCAQGKARPPTVDRPSTNFAHVTDLMTVNKALCREVAQMLYGERCFAVHVHGDTRDGGVEFLDSGSQPLHYQADTGDSRFLRFGRDDEYGFHRVRKLDVHIFRPSRTSSRCAVIKIYYMNLALCRLLKRSCGSHGAMTRVCIQFVDGPARRPPDNGGGPTVECEWRNRHSGGPLETVIHGICDVDLVLRPFAQLTRCGSVRITLPRSVETDGGLLERVTEMRRGMEGKAGGLYDDALEERVERVRAAADDFMSNTLYGAAP